MHPILCSSCGGTDAEDSGEDSDDAADSGDTGATDGTTGGADSGDTGTGGEDSGDGDDADDQTGTDDFGDSGDTGTTGGTDGGDRGDDGDDTDEGFDVGDFGDTGDDFEGDDFDDSDDAFGSSSSLPCLPRDYIIYSSGAVFPTNGDEILLDDLVIEAGQILSIDLLVHVNRGVQNGDVLELQAITEAVDSEGNVVTGSGFFSQILAPVAQLTNSNDVDRDEELEETDVVDYCPEAECGNGVVNEGEECDDGDNNSDTQQNACRTDCTLPYCGDFIIDTEYGEICDTGDGNIDGIAGRCQTDCTIVAGEPFCGNGAIDRGEECDDGNLKDFDGCSSLCYLETGFCSDGTLQIALGEQCDDGNRVSGDGCSDACLLEEVAGIPICGNGIVDEFEECDDGNKVNFDGCSAVCLLEAGSCGDGILQRALGEQCEPSLHSASLPFECSAACRYRSLFCSDSKIDPGEECDFGIYNSDEPGSRCRTDCSLPRCGDGILDPEEQCDDGNRLYGDECDQYCRIGDGVHNTITINFPGEEGHGGADEGDLPIGNLIPVTPDQTPIGDTGPAAATAVAIGAGSGFAWMRYGRRRRKL